MPTIDELQNEVIEQFADFDDPFASAGDAE